MFCASRFAMTSLCAALAVSLSLNLGKGFAADKATAAEAEALVKKAVSRVKEKGQAAAVAEFNKPAGEFRVKDLYIVAFDMNGKGLAHLNPRLIGVAAGDVKDVDGKMIFREYVKVVNAKGKGWVDYKWPNPTTGVIEAKSTYVEKVDDIIVGAGVYK